MKNKEKFEHYQVRIAESDRYIWYANSKGFVYKVLKSNGKVIQLSGYQKRGFKITKVRGYEENLSHLIASTFMRNYYDGCLIGYKDGDKSNCNVENLFIYSREEHGKNTGYLSKGKGVLLVKDGKKKRYRSVREAAKSIHVSDQTLLDYLGLEEVRYLRS